MDLNLTRKVVIVTGGASNIGRGIAHAFAAEGALVVIADIDEARAKAVVSEANNLGAAASLAVRTDVTNWQSVKAMVEVASREFGHVDILINNAGWTVDRYFLEKAREEWEKEVAVNLWGPINGTRAVLDGMVARSSGAIVSIASDAGRIGEYREAVYGACKAGVISLTKSLARELGRHKIRLNVVCPGATLPQSAEDIGDESLWNQKEMQSWLKPEIRDRISKAYPLGRSGTASDIASAVLFLASDAASFITGQTLSVSGGYSMV